jgi:hypothetical protein
MPASEEMLQRVAANLRERNFETLVVSTRAEAKDAVMDRIPEGSEVHSAKSKTLEDIGVFQELMNSDHYDFLRNRLFQMDRKLESRAMRKLEAAPDIMLGSVQALTEAGQLVSASASGKQLGPYASGAGNLILVVGSQKIVPDLETAICRISNHVQPYEEARLRREKGIGTKLARILILERDYDPGRTVIILVREPVGV